MPEPRELSYEHSHVPLVEDVYETANELLETLVKQSLQTRQVVVRSCIINWGYLERLQKYGSNYFNFDGERNREKEIDR